MDLKTIVWVIIFVLVGYFIGRKWPNLLPLPGAAV